MASKQTSSKDSTTPKPKAPPTIDIGDLTEVVTASIQRAMGAQGLGKFPGQIIIGIIFRPPEINQPELK
jgi:hypothetical protein